MLTPICVLCGNKAQSNNLCLDCQANLPSLPHSCIQCGRFLTFPHEQLCGKCLSYPPPYDTTLALFPYQQPIIKLLTGLKFKGKLVYAKLFSKLLIEKIQHYYKEITLPDVIIPVPLHPARLRERGFNQALEIVRPIARFFKIPMDYQATKRKKQTLAQAQLNARARQQNVRGAFKCSGNYSGLTVAVFDDVITTGATVTALSKVLRQQGASNIHLWCCARKG